MVVNLRQKVTLTVVIDYDPDAYAAHLGTHIPVDRDLPMRVAQSVRFAVEQPSWDAPVGTVVRVTDWHGL